MTRAADAQHAGRGAVGGQWHGGCPPTLFVHRARAADQTSPVPHPSPSAEGGRSTGVLPAIHPGGLRLLVGQLNARVVSATVDLGST